MCALAEVVWVDLAKSYSHFEECPKSYLNSSSTSPTDTRLLGLCTGLLAATAVASVDSLTALLPLAVEVIRIAFRTGVHVWAVSERIEGRLDRQESWSTILAGIDAKSAEGILNRFHQEHVSTDYTSLRCNAQANTVDIKIQSPLDQCRGSQFNHRQRPAVYP